MELVWTAKPAPPVARSAQRVAATEVTELSPTDTGSVRNDQWWARSPPRSCKPRAQEIARPSRLSSSTTTNDCAPWRFACCRSVRPRVTSCRTPTSRPTAGLHEFRGESKLGTWLYRIVYTTCLNHLRDAARDPLLADVGDGRQQAAAEAGLDPSDEIAAAADLAALLETLPPEQRAAVVLVDAHGLGYARTAEILGVPQGTVASRVASARAKLRRALAPDGEVTVPPSRRRPHE